MNQIRIISPAHRGRALAMVEMAPLGHVVTVKEMTRSLDQNSKLWALIADIKDAKPEGRDWPEDVWKAGLMVAAGRHAEWFPGLDGQQVWPYLNQRSSNLSKREFSYLIACGLEYGDRHGVQWREYEKWSAE